MADKETEEWAAKSKRIQEERMKANRALAKEDFDASSVAFLDPKTRHKGYSKNSSDVARSFERAANTSLVLAIAGVIFWMINSFSGVVSNTHQSGAAVLGYLAGAGESISVAVSAFLAVTVLISSIVFEIKDGRKFGSEFSTAIGAIVVLSIYVVLKYFLMH